MAESLRILVILPMYGGSLPVGRFCQQALEELGHFTDVFEAPDFYGAYRAFESLRVSSGQLDKLKNQYFHMVSRAAMAKVEAFSPDLVLAMAQAPLSVQTLGQLRRGGVATAMWFVEDYALFPYWRIFAPLYDVFAVIQKEPFFGQLKKIGVQAPLYLPLAAHPPFHRPLDLERDLDEAERREFAADVSFLGAGYPNRRQAFRQLLNSGFKIWGSDWDGDEVLRPSVQRDGARISSEDAVKIFNASKVNLNLHSSMNAATLVSRGDFVNPRTFEVAACGAFQLVDRRDLLGELFTTGADGELATFSSMAELEEGIAHYLAHPEERAAMAERARARVLKEHTYAHRMAALIEHVRSVHPALGRGKDTAAPLGELPPDLREELDALLKALHLPADVEFNDLVAAVRKQQGTLSELETALLFLDEWRKQYSEKNE